MLPQASLLISIILVVSVANGQTCTSVFDVGVEISSPLDTITFDNLNETLLPWASVTPTPFRVTPDSSMEVTITGNVEAGANFVLITNGYTDLKNAGWNKEDFYVSFMAFRNVATLTFAEPIRQFSMQVAHSSDCIPLSWKPYIVLQNSTGGQIAIEEFVASPPAGSANFYQIIRFRSSCADVKSITLAGCQIVMDNLSYKVDPCSPNPCNLTTENCFDAGLDATCCPKVSTWNGVKCITGNPCIDLEEACDPLATCSPLRTGGFKCTCPPKYIGTGTPGNCTLLESAPSNVTYDITPILECVDVHNVAQFGYISNERSVLLIDDPSRNNLEPLNTAPVLVFSYGRSQRYPLNPGQVLLNAASGTTYVWHLENHNLTFTKESARPCPIYLSIIFQFVISGTVNVPQFADHTRTSFISVTNVDASRVAIVNVTDITAGNKRAVTLQDQTQLEIEISIAGAENSSSAEVIQNFDQNQQDDFLYELNQAYPNQTISVSVVSTQAAPVTTNTPSVPSTQQPQSQSQPQSPTAAPKSFIASTANALNNLYFALVALVLLSLV